MNVNDAQVRAWASRHGRAIPANQPVPEALRERYRQARNYMIRLSYARRSGKREDSRHD